MRRLPGIELDEHAQPRARVRGGRREVPRPGQRIEPDAQRGARALVERPQARGLGAVAPDRIRDEDVGDPARGEHLRLAEVPDRDALRARAELDPGEGDALVGLRVRPQGDAPLRQRRDEARRVPLDDIEVDHELGRVEPGRESRRDHRRVWRGGSRCRCWRRHQRRVQTDGVLEQLPNRLRQLAGRHVGERRRFQNRAHARAERDPDVTQARGSALVLHGLGCGVANARKWPVDRPDDVGQGDGRCGAGELVAAAAPPTARDEPGSTQVGEEVLEVLGRDALRAGDRLAANGRAPVRGRELEERADRVVGPRGDPHAPSVGSAVRLRRTPNRRPPIGATDFGGAGTPRRSPRWPRRRAATGARSMGGSRTGSVRGRG